MSLKTGKAFIDALRSNDDLMRTLGAKGKPLSGARLFSVARSAEDDQQDKIPYVIMMPKGITTNGTKDDYDFSETATIDLLVVAKSFPDLVELTQTVRDTVEQKLESGDDFIIDDWTFSADAVQMDNNKPCYFQTLTYQCNTQKR